MGNPMIECLKIVESPLAQALAYRAAVELVAKAAPKVLGPWVPAPELCEEWEIAIKRMDIARNEYHSCVFRNSNGLYEIMYEPEIHLPMILCGTFSESQKAKQAADEYSRDLGFAILDML